MVRETGAVLQVCFVSLHLLLTNCNHGSSECHCDGCTVIDADALGAGSADAGDASICIVGDFWYEGDQKYEIGLLEKIKEITGSLIIYQTDLTDLVSWTQLERIGGTLSISSNAQLQTVDPPRLKEISGEVLIAANPKLHSIVMSDLVQSESLVILSNPALEVLRCDSLAMLANDFALIESNSLLQADFPSLTAIGGGVNIRKNKSLRSVQLLSLETIGGMVLIAENTNLSSPLETPNLQWIGSFVQIRNNPMLQHIEVSAVINGLLVISENSSLIDVSGRAPAEQQSGDGSNLSIVIDQNLLLQTIEGFNNLKSLQGVAITGNDRLQKISGFSSLENIDAAGLEISKNEDLSGEALFPALKSASSVGIYSNPKLPPAVVDELLSRVIVAGDTKIGNNEGQMTIFTPCLWPNDQICDESEGTGLCAFDPGDCDE